MPWLLLMVGLYDLGIWFSVSVFHPLICCQRFISISGGDSKYECSACGKTFVSETNLKRHRQVHQEPQVCHCGATFSTKEALKEHENAKHKRLYVCKECPVWRQFFSRSGLFSHCILAHKTNSTLKVS